MLCLSNLTIHEFGFGFGIVKLKLWTKIRTFRHVINHSNNGLVKLDRDIPELLPMYGRRIKIYHGGIQKFCKNCFGKHPTKNCESQKVQWIEYVRPFKMSNPEIKKDYYGKWIDILAKPSRGNQRQSYFQTKIDFLKIMTSSLSCRYSRLFYPPFGSYINESDCLLLILGACGRGQ